MSSTTAPAPTTSRTPLLAVIGLAASAMASAVGTFWDLTGNDSGNSGFGDYWPVLVIAAIGAAVVYGLVVRGASPTNAGRRSAILGVAAFLLSAVFWTGLPLVVASASVACALIERDGRGSFGAGSRAGLALSAITAVAAVVLAITA